MKNNEHKEQQNFSKARYTLKTSTSSSWGDKQRENGIVHSGAINQDVESLGDSGEAECQSRPSASRLTDPCRILQREDACLWAVIGQ